jgi:membrane protease subunit HflK
VRYRNQAEAYALDILPKARGDATQMRESALAYRDQVIAQAEGETSRFLQTMEEYEKAPEITRKRMYLETMEYVLANNSKVLLQVTDSNSLMYLPLDKLMEKQTGGRTDIESVDINMAPANTGQNVPLRSRTPRDGGGR